LLDPLTRPDPTGSRGSPSGVLLLLPDLLNGFFNEYFSSFDHINQM